VWVQFRLGNLKPFVPVTQEQHRLHSVTIHTQTRERQSFYYLVGNLSNTWCSPARNTRTCNERLTWATEQQPSVLAWQVTEEKRITVHSFSGTGKSNPMRTDQKTQSELRAKSSKQGDWGLFGARAGDLAGWGTAADTERAGNRSGNKSRAAGTEIPSEAGVATTKALEHNTGNREWNTELAPSTSHTWAATRQNPEARCAGSKITDGKMNPCSREPTKPEQDATTSKSSRCRAYPWATEIKTET
jgi:hypothetical protein